MAQNGPSSVPHGRVMSDDTLRVLVVDDEPLARRKLRRLLLSEPGVSLVGEASSGTQALELLGAEAIDVVFLDVQMPGLNGFELLERLPAERTPALVFVTAYDEYAVRAFEVEAVDYLLKPFDRARLQTALGRAQHRLAGRTRGLQTELRSLLDLLGTPARYVERFPVRKAGGIVLVAASDVDWIEAQGNYVALHVGSDTHLVRRTMTSLEQRLDPRRFARVHRTAIVNLEKVVALRPWETDEHVVVLKTGMRIAASRGFRDQLEVRLGGLSDAK
jgi:two-component system LytT family response regulator